MKKFLMLFLSTVLILTVSYAQTTKEEDEEEEEITGFQKYNLFTGGHLNVGFGSGSFSLGVGPYFGYSLNKYIDVALGLNYNYISQRPQFSSIRKRQSIIGPTSFVRVYPVKFLFAHAQYEYNLIKYKVLPGNGLPNQSEKINVSSFLVGPGFANGREDERSFYFISILFDVAKNINSPYTDLEGRMDPIIRVGFNIALFGNDEPRSSKKKRGIY
ncbi:MAG: hypothetical protein LH615_00780 [Ferruginibacter sp.]|nr:hypothetical protein [Ferruginibacter sp.]